MKNIRKKVRFHFNLKSKHLLVIMTLFCGSCIVATAASGTSSAPLIAATHNPNWISFGILLGFFGDIVGTGLAILFGHFLHFLS